MGMSHDLDATLEALGPEAATVEQSPRSTIVPPRLRASTAGHEALEELKRIGPITSGVGDGRLSFEEVLGEGGMGVVRLATQVALGRKVAVKTLRADMHGEASTLKLVREAWVTGAVEHPNVVPVHDLGLDDEGLPVIVLKRIAGTAWADLMHDAAAVARRFGATDLLEWNLHILGQVCNAVHFAHSRGIVHRDLKPENVMIGAFGEVYVVDWGIAVALEDDGSGRLPLASNAIEMAGTPCYMAPEMLGGPEPRLSEQTDVYLLGAILHEIAVGKPPHDGHTLMAILSSIIGPPKQLPQTVPEELRLICRRALEPDPAGRFENAEQVRLAIQGFLRHRESMQLAEQATARLEQMDAQLAARGGDADQQRVALYHLFGECRFGLQQAVRSWPDNERAKHGLRDALTRMVEYELAEGDAKAAALLLAQMDAAPDGLRQRVESARQAMEAEQGRIAELERRDRELDPAVGQRTRGLLLGVFGAIWTLLPIGLAIRDTAPNYLELIGHSAVLLALAVGLGVWARESMSRTSVNRRVFSTLVLVSVAQMALGLAGLLLGLSASMVELLYPFLYFLTCAMVGIYLDRRFALLGLVYLASLLIGAVRPDLRYWLFTASNGALALVIALYWRSTLKPLV